MERGQPHLLHVNALATFTLRWLIPRLSAFQMANPAVEVRLTTSNVPLLHLVEPFDVAIRGGPDERPGLIGRPFLTERRMPVCSPTLLRRMRLREPAELKHPALLHSATLSNVWPQWPRAADVPSLEPQASITLEHFYLTLQAALDGFGVAMGPERLIADDVAAGRLVLPFVGPKLPARSYVRTYPNPAPTILPGSRFAIG